MGKSAKAHVRENYSYRRHYDTLEGSLVEAARKSTIAREYDNEKVIFNIGEATTSMFDSDRRFLLFFKSYKTHQLSGPYPERMGY